MTGPRWLRRSDTIAAVADVLMLLATAAMLGLALAMFYDFHGVLDWLQAWGLNVGRR